MFTTLETLDLDDVFSRLYQQKQQQQQERSNYLMDELTLVRPTRLIRVVENRINFVGNLMQDIIAFSIKPD